MTEFPAGDDGLVGVRFPGDPSVVFCVAGRVDCRTGEWVMLGRNGVERPGRVVIAAGRWSGSPVASGWSVVRGLGDEDPGHMPTSLNLFPASPAQTEIGSTGPPESVTPDRSDGTVVSSGGEDERFRRLKHAFPRLGQSVQTGKGDGTVIEVDTVRRQVTCVLRGDGSEIVVPVDDMLASPPTS